MDYSKLANLLFKDIDKTPDYYENLFPKREVSNDAKVTRLAPSPTGFIHLGNLYGAFVDERLAKQSNGIFYLRIEDTDDKRYVEGATEVIINSLKYFGLNFDEGATVDGQIGDYGDYYQSNRGEIYQCYVKRLVEQGLAYPCFMTPEELVEIREIQEQNKNNYGIYGKWAKYRDLSYEEIESRILSGEQYVIRLRSSGNLELPKEQIKMVSVDDGIRGELKMPENNQDIVILKANGIPTYHFAHAVDDHLMRTTHVIRGAEWLPSLPIHVELFNKLGFELPIYCHTAQLMKIDEEGNKRKLSKRKDPELSLDYYVELGYHPLAVKEYLLTILNSNYEEWRLANPLANIDDFEFTVEKMSNSGALFDLTKLNDVSKDVLSKMSAKELSQFMINWATVYKPAFAIIFEERKDYLEQILDLGRSGDKPRKDLIYASQIFDFISYFFDEAYLVSDELPDNIDSENAISILNEYVKTYDHNDDNEGWFNKIKDICTSHNYATRPKDHKKNPDQYKGHVGHVATLIRLAVTSRQQSPDVWEIQQILSKEKTLERVNNFINVIKLISVK